MNVIQGSAGRRDAGEPKMPEITAYVDAEQQRGVAEERERSQQVQRKKRSLTVEEGLHQRAEAERAFDDQRHPHFQAMNPQRQVVKPATQRIRQRHGEVVKAHGREVGPRRIAARELADPAPDHESHREELECERGGEVVVAECEQREPKVEL